MPNSIPSHEVEEFIRCYEEDFDILIPFPDAERILILFDELYELLEEYSEAGDVPPPLLGHLLM